MGSWKHLFVCKTPDQFIHFYDLGNTAKQITNEIGFIGTSTR